MKLRIRIPLIYTLLIALLGVVFIVFTSRFVEDRMVEEEEEYFRSITKTLALNSANAIVLKDYAALSGIVDNMAKGEHVNYAIILDENGMVIAHSRHELEGTILNDPESRKAAASRDLLMQAVGPDTMDVTAPLMIAGQKWGAVRIGFSLGEMKIKVARAKNLILFSGFIMVLFGGIVSVFIAKKITDPIHKLHRGAELIGEGNLDHRLDISTGDEIEQLAAAFNTMTANLKENYLAIEKAKNEWEKTFDAISDPLFIHDKEFRVIRCNRAYAEAAGISFQEIIGKPYYEIFPKTDGPMKRCLKVLETQEEGEEGLSLRDGGKTYKVSFYLIKDAAGGYLYSLHIMEDITERKKAEEALRESEEKFRTISISAKDAILMMDNDGNISFWNEAAVTIFGHTAQEALGRELHTFLAPDRYHAAYRAGFPKFKETGEGPAVGKVLELTAVKKDGTEFPMELSVSVVKLKDKWHAIGILRDITERKQAEEDIHDLFVAALSSLASAIEAKSPWTRGHSERVTEYALKIGKEMGLSDDVLDDLRMAGLLHDIGKIGTYDGILDKPEELTDEEYEIVKKHPVKGMDMLLPIKQLRHIIPWIRGHHERYDGKGYPDGLKGEEISPQARILAVADTFDSMTAERPYRETPGKEKAIEELKKYSGTQFDPEVVEAFLRVLHKNS
ncbi:MAG: PAS domain S-box protein [Nitrospirae bacterium]|nr:PAS domain S-box protein [Nitrospirota bacterium]